MTAVVLLVGLWVFGTGEALLLDARLRSSPWTVLAQGLSRHSQLSSGARRSSSARLPTPAPWVCSWS
jgi:uncharacterized membrane protein YczE